MTEELGKSLFLLPELTPETVLTVLRLALERLPLDALKGFQAALGLAENLFNDAGSAITAILDAFVARPIMQTVEAFTEWLNETFGPLNTIINQLLDVLQGNVVTPINETIQNVIDWVSTLGADSLPAILAQFETFLNGITNLETWLGVFKQVVDFFLGITNRTTWLPILKNLVDTFVTLSTTVGANLWTVLGGVITTFSTLLTAVGTTVWTLITEIIEFFDGVFTGAGSVNTWFNNVLTNLSKLPAWKLYGSIPAAVMGVLNIGHLTTDPVNLILNPDFADLDTVSPVEGWSWDGTTNATGTGGSAKIVLDGFNKELNHQTAVLVAPGDKMTATAQFKSSGVTGTGWKAAITVMEYRNGAIATPVELASRTTNSAGWVTLAGDYLVPANVTSVVFRLVVEGATGGTAWFDNLSFHKSGILEQGWVENLPNTWENMWSGQFGDGTGVGKTWADMGNTIRSGRDKTTLAQQAGDGAQGNVQTTWNGLYDAFGYSTGSVGITPALLNGRGAALRDVAATGVTNAGIAVGAASVADGKAVAAAGAAATADGKAVDVATGIRRTVGGEPGTTGVPASAGTYLSNLITKMYGSGASVPQTYINNAALNEIPTTKLLGNISGANITTSTIPVGALAPATIPAIGTALGTAITTGSGAKMSRTNTATKVTAGTGDNWFSAFFVNAGGSIQQDQISSDITVTSNGRYTVTHAGYYIVELGFTVNAAKPAAGYFNVAPAIFLNGSSTPHKVGSDAMGSFGGGLGNCARTAHATFIVYLAAGGTVTAGYRNYGASNGSFFEGDANGNSTYFSIAMLNRTAQG
jgi:hypothetical protein